VTDNEPRLLDSANATTRALLESALRDRAPATGPARTAMALGLGEVGAPEPTLADAAGILPGVVAGKASVSGLSAGMLAGTGKWLVMGLIAGSAASLASFAHQQRVRPGATENVSERLLQSAANAPLTPPRGAPPAPPVPSAANELVNEGAPPSHAPGRANATATPAVRAPVLALDTSSGVMARETAWIDQARAALRRGDIASARRNLATYAAERRIGVLDREALLLGVELAVAEGDRGRALRLAADFEAKYPNDVHLPRARELVEKSTR
jgi:hypothetical protein